MDYVAPKLPDDYAKQINSALRKKIPQMSHERMIVSLMTVCLENGRLVTEVNQLREQLGISPMPRIMP